jgi:hypothetical protein
MQSFNVNPLITLPVAFLLIVVAFGVFNMSLGGSTTRDQRTANEQSGSTFTLYTVRFRNSSNDDETLVSKQAVEVDPQSSTGSFPPGPMVDPLEDAVVRQKVAKVRIATGRRRYPRGSRSTGTSLGDNASTLETRPAGKNQNVKETAAPNPCPRYVFEAPGRTPPEIISQDFGGIEKFCSRFDRLPQMDISKRPPKIYVGLMLNFELDILQVYLEEVGALVDSILLVESSTTHSLGYRPLVWPQHKNESRWDPWRSKIDHRIWYMDPIQMKASGWDVERGQREAFMVYLLETNVAPDSLILANLDLDEIPKREAILFWKYCKINETDYSFQRIHFRYNTGCLQPGTIFADIASARTLVYRWPVKPKHKKMRLESVYRARGVREIPNPQPTVESLSKRIQQSANLFWHFSGFGSPEDVYRKNSHSPHTHLRALSFAQTVSMIENCELSEVRGHRVKLEPSALPLAMQRNRCYYQWKGWIPKD